MVQVPVQCPPCRGINGVRYGKQPKETQRDRCDNVDCPRPIFLLPSHDTGRRPEGKRYRVDRTLNGRGVRDIVRVLGVSAATVLDTLKNKQRSSRK
jgi:transposase-like protein